MRKGKIKIFKVAEGSRHYFEKLSRDNYQVWSYQMELLLIKEDLWETITEDVPEPKTSAWIKSDYNAGATIG